MKEYSPSKFCDDMSSIMALGFKNGITGKNEQIDYSKLHCGNEETYDAWSKIYAADCKRFMDIMENI